MNNHLNMLLKQAKFDLKCAKMRWRLGLRSRPRWGTLRRSPKPPNRERNPSHHKFLATPLDQDPDVRPMVIWIAGAWWHLKYRPVASGG